MNPKLFEKINESLAAVLPISGIVIALSILLVPIGVGQIMLFIVGSAMLILGMGLFQLGAEMSMSPLGEGIGVHLSRLQKTLLIAGTALLMGIIITVAEPDLQVLAEQVPSIPNLTLIITVAVGVGLFLALAVVRTIWKIKLSVLLFAMYLLLIGLSFLIPESFIAVAFDSGGVTTGPITVPFIMAMGVGLASIRGDKDAADDSFGLVALSSGGPILAVLLLGCFFRPEGSVTPPSASIETIDTMREVAKHFVQELPHFARDVFVSIVPIAAVFLLFQLLSRRYQKRQRRRILVGFGYTYLGLVLFLCGVDVGFAPIGTLLGRELASTPYNWVLVPIGMMIGYFIVKAEPAIQILNQQVQQVTDGAISHKSMNLCLSVGVSVSVGIAMLRILTGISLQWIIIPGYAAALIMSRFVPKIFVGIAFDSGGVASGPMTTTFLLPLSIGACEMSGGNVMTDAFGVVALVALTPLIAVQIMGLRYRFKMNRLRKAAALVGVLPADSDVIVELVED